MIADLSGKSLPAEYRYAPDVEAACLDVFSPPLAYAIAWHESIQGEVNDKWTAATVLSGDGGHGLFQLTSQFPDDWEQPPANARFAVAMFLEPALLFWTEQYHLAGDDLVRAIAAEFNAGRSGALAGHHAGDVDKYTSDNYAAAVLRIYENLVLDEPL